MQNSVQFEKVSYKETMLTDYYNELAQDIDNKVNIITKNVEVEDILCNVPIPNDNNVYRNSHVYTKDYNNTNILHSILIIERSSMNDLIEYTIVYPETKTIIPQFLIH